MEVWKMSLIPDVSLSRNVQNLSTSDTDGSSKNPTIESSHEFEDLSPDFDRSLRLWALMFLKNSIGWIDSSGNLIEGEHPKLGSLTDNVKGKKPPSVDSQPFISRKTSSAPGPQAVLEDGDTKLVENFGGKAVAVPSPDGTDKAERATPRGTQEGSDENPVREKARELYMSATLHDGTLVIPSFAVCCNMKNGNGKGFSDILRIISQWRMQACGDLDHENRRKPLLVYVFSETYESSISIEFFRKGPDWFEQPMTLYKLHHTLPTSGCSYVNFEPLPQTVLKPHQLRQRKKTLRTVLKYGLKRHWGFVDKAGVLRKSKQPSINQFLYDLKVPINLYSSAGTEVMESPKARYVQPDPMNIRQAEETHEKAQKISISDQIENVMRLAGDLYDVSTMLNGEISIALSQTDGYPACDQVNPNWRNESNPVLETRKNGQINIDAAKRAISQVKVRLRNQWDKAHILAHLCERWKGELEIEYPLMNREPVSRSGIHNLAIPPSRPSRAKSPATGNQTLATLQQPVSSPKIRYLFGGADSSEPQPAVKPWSPSKLRYKDQLGLHSTTPHSMKHDERLDAQQDRSSNKDDSSGSREQTFSRHKKRDDEDDEFSIFPF
ncbi:hypothetical protein KCU77_g1006, partial [Aureobasidium melanogenum]